MAVRIPDWLRYEIQEKWEETVIAVRERINAHPRVIIAVSCASVLLLFVTVIGLLSSGKTPVIKEPKKGWYYDLNTGNLFTSGINQAGPIEAPSGPLPNGEPAGVRAYVLTYSNEPNENERFIGFLEKPDPNAKEDAAEISGLGIAAAQQWGGGKLIRRVNDDIWVPADSYEGLVILREVLRPDKAGQSVRYCPP